MALDAINRTNRLFVQEDGKGRSVSAALMPQVEHGCPPAPLYCRLAHPLAVGLAAVAIDAVQDKHDGSESGQVWVVVAVPPPIERDGAPVFAF